MLVTKEEMRPERLAGATAIVLDVFMATSTLLTILENGARRVFVARNLAEVDAFCRRPDVNTVLRGGEQMAQRVEGYDCGPFPDEYPPELVDRRDVVYVSTNGTTAIADAAAADRVLVASLRNAPAVAAHLQRERPESVYIVCAGSLGRLALDDLVGAMSIMAHLDPHEWAGNDAARLAWELAETYDGRLRDLVRLSRSGGWHFANDRRDIFDFVTDVGASDLVAEFRAGELVRLEGGAGEDPALGAAALPDRGDARGSRGAEAS